MRYWTVDWLDPLCSQQKRAFWTYDKPKSLLTFTSCIILYSHRGAFGQDCAMEEHHTPLSSIPSSPNPTSNLPSPTSFHLTPCSWETIAHLPSEYHFEAVDGILLAHPDMPHGNRPHQKLIKVLPTFLSLYLLNCVVSSGVNVESISLQDDSGTRKKKSRVGKEKRALNPPRVEYQMFSLHHQTQIPLLPHTSKESMLLPK